MIAAQIVLALGTLHKHGYIYRDLRPENILLEESGFIKLSDFGISKNLKNQTTNTFCGCSEYLAPEIILGKEQDKNVDWWSFGILLYELTYGHPPFFDENTERLYELICHSEVKFPEVNNLGASSQNLNELKKLITQLLNKNKFNRIGNTEDLIDLKSHSYFSNVNFESVYQKNFSNLISFNFKNFYGQKTHSFINKDGLIARKSELNLISPVEICELTKNFDRLILQNSIEDSIVGNDELELIDNSKDLFFDLLN